ncbi:MAG: hypothetical protein ABFD91_17805, partial [Anaerohalosphaeraceae bacterium]
MLTITVLKNPFNHSEKENYACEYSPGKSVYEYIQPYIMGLDEYIVSVNGNVVENAKEQLAGSDDWLAVCPVVGKSGSDWFRSAFTIALGTWTGNGFAKYLGKINVKGVWGALAKGVVGMIGG